MSAASKRLAPRDYDGGMGSRRRYVPGSHFIRERQHVAGFRDLKVWQLSRALAVDVYEACKALPPSETQILSSQMRRAAISIPANIAEGTGRPTARDQAKYYRTALASARELESHLELATDIGMMPRSTRDAILVRLDEVQRMLTGLTKSAVRRTARR